MMRVPAFTLLAAAATTALLAAPGDAETARSKRNAAAIAAAKPAGKPESCIQLNHIRETRVRSDSVIDFYMHGKKVYRNTLPHSCPQLGFEERFTYSTSLSQLCSTDIITVLMMGGPGLMRGASCGLGKFQPVTGVPK
jgi:hypothetical protein